jgi:nicotinamidase-related amidase
MYRKSGYQITALVMSKDPVPQASPGRGWTAKPESAKIGAPMNAALLVIDMQNGFLIDRPCHPGLPSALEYINAAIDLFVTSGQPIFVVQDEDAREEPGASSYDVVDGLKSAVPALRMMSKKYSNAFWQTSLEKQLRELDAHLIVLAGFAAEGCVNYTYNGALERGFHAVLLRHGVMSRQPDYLRFVHETCNTITYSTLRFLLSQP